MHYRPMTEKASDRAPASRRRLARHGAATLVAILVLAGAGLPEDIPVPTPAPRIEEPAAPDDEPPPPPPDPAPEKPDKAALAQCEQRLTALGAVFERRPAVDGSGECGMPASYAVTRIAAGVALAPETEMRCRTALATAQWVSQVVAPAATVFGDTVRLTGIRQASTYACRSRNSVPGAKLSEHALGNAIDIAAFEFDGHPALAVMPDQRKGSLEEAFQKAVRAGACLHFTTVLGPGSDAFHDTHIHLDLASRRGGYRLCQ